MIVGRWYVQLAAKWHWYLPLYVNIYNFVLFLFIPFLYSCNIYFLYTLSGIDKSDGMHSDIGIS